MGYYILLATAVTAFLMFNYSTDFKFPKQFVLNILCILMLGYHIYMVSNVTLALLATFMMLSSNYLGFWKYIDHPCYSLKNRSDKFLYTAASHLVEMMVLAVLFIFIPASTAGDIVNLMPIFAVVGAITTFFPLELMCIPRKEKLTSTGFGSNTSVNSTIMSFIGVASLGSTLPYHAGLIGFIVAFSAVIKSGGMAGITGSALAGIIYLGYYCPKLSASIIIIGIAVYIYLITRPREEQPIINGLQEKTWKYYPPQKMFSLSHREKIWYFAIKKVRPYGNKYLGLGVGGTFYAMPAVQIREKEPLYTTRRELFCWLHNDIIQFYIDTGIVGAVLLVAVFAQLIYNGSMAPCLMAFLGCLIVNLFANFPTKLAADSFIIAMVLRHWI